MSSAGPELRPGCAGPGARNDGGGGGVAMRRREVASPVPAGCRNTLERADVRTKQLTVAPTLRVRTQHVLTGGVDAWASPAHILKRLYLRVD